MHIQHPDMEPQKVRARPGANNLPGALAFKPGWDHPVMMFAKLIIWRYALSKAKSEEALVDRTDWAAMGITGASLLREVRHLNPAFDEVWAEQNRKEGDAVKGGGNGLHGRLWYMYRERKKGVEGAVQKISREHPMSSSKVGRHRAAAYRLCQEGKPVPRHIVEEVFK